MIPISMSSIPPSEVKESYVMKELFNGIKSKEIL